MSATKMKDMCSAYNNHSPEDKLKLRREAALLRAARRAALDASVSTVPDGDADDEACESTPWALGDCLRPLRTSTLAEQAENDKDFIQERHRRWSAEVGSVIGPGNDEIPPSPSSPDCSRCSTSCSGNNPAQRSWLQDTLDIIASIVAPRGVGFGHEHTLVGMGFEGRPVVLGISMSLRKSPFVAGEFLLAEVADDCDLTPPFEVTYQEEYIEAMEMCLPPIVAETDFARNL